MNLPNNCSKDDELNKKLQIFFEELKFCIKEGIDHNNLITEPNYIPDPIDMLYAEYLSLKRREIEKHICTIKYNLKRNKHKETPSIP